MPSSNTNNIQFVIVVTTDCADPYVYGPYASEHDAEIAVTALQAGWSNDDWNDFTGIVIRELVMAK